MRFAVTALRKRFAPQSWGGVVQRAANGEVEPKGLFPDSGGWRIPLPCLPGAGKHLGSSWQAEGKEKLNRQGWISQSGSGKNETDRSATPKALLTFMMCGLFRIEGGECDYRTAPNGRGNCTGRPRRGRKHCGMSLAKAWWLCLGTWWQQRFLALRCGPKQPADERRWDLAPDAAATYHLALSAEIPSLDQVDDRTWSDLELDKVFVRLDRATTPLGCQYLYTLLRKYEHRPDALRKRNRLRQVLAGDPGLGAALRKALVALNQPDAEGLAAVLYGPTPQIPRQYRWFYLPAGASIACTFGLMLKLWFLWPLLALIILNLLLHWHFARRVSHRAPALKGLAALLGSVPALNRAVGKANLPLVDELRALLAPAQQLQKRISLGLLRRMEVNDLTVAFLEYLNLFCLFELCALCRALESIIIQQAMLRRVFEVVAQLDCWQGLALTLSRYPHTCLPQFESGRSFTFVDVYHPLVDGSVGNTLQGQGRSVLLSGTNMSGKTTFLKALGVNLILAQTLGLCFATAATLPRARVRTIIQRRDSLEGGQSYFLREAKVLLSMMREAEEGNVLFWFLVDEPFRGTNSAERIAAGEAVLGYLNQKWFVVASTHDQELGHALAAEFDSYHFAEIIQGADARFDYRLRPGLCTSRNAIRLLTLAGFPSSVTDQAAARAQGM